ncbi:MAG: hypothetical protein CGW95_13910, partial [Phenylobacterium zucineum]
MDLRRIELNPGISGQIPKLADLLTMGLNPEQSTKIDAGALLELLRAVPCVVILDGLDEVGTRLGVQKAASLYRQFLDLVPRPVWNAESQDGKVDWSACGTRLMVTCRTQFFESNIQQKSTLTDYHRHTPSPVREGEAKITTYYMAPFSPDQISDYICKTLGREPGTRLFEAMNRTGNLADLARKPLMTRYISEIGPTLLADTAAGRKINAGWVFQRLFEQALARDGEKRIAMTPTDRAVMLEALAAHYWQNQTPTLPIRRLETWFDRYVQDNPGLRFVMQSGTEARALLHTELRNASLLMRGTADDFRFDHTSFYEFFLGRYLLAALTEGQFAQLKTCPPVSDECVNFLLDISESERRAADLGEALGRHLVATVPQILRQLAVRILMAGRALGFDWPLPLAADLSGLDLKDHIWKPAPRSRQVLRGASFAGANLQASAFSRFDFYDCDFTDARMFGATFDTCGFEHCRGAPRFAASVRQHDCRLDEASKAGSFQALILAFPPPPGVEISSSLRGLDFHTASLKSAVFSPD